MVTLITPGQRPVTSPASTFLKGSCGVWMREPSSPHGPPIREGLRFSPGPLLPEGEERRSHPTLKTVDNVPHRMERAKYGGASKYADKYFLSSEMRRQRQFFPGWDVG
jgi:hypothetical protein